MPENKKSSISLWVGVAGIFLSLLSAYASGAELALQSTVSQAFGSGHQDGDSDKRSRCQIPVNSAKSLHKDERSKEELTKICLALPNSHDSTCGFPSSTDEYFVVENNQCVSRTAGLSLSHPHARKVEARARPVSGHQENESGENGDGNATGAQ